ncbi:hypothetical protein B484DRAFT_264471 [Ochromonadaceae sp. CCMP2298]|nr:hypothetical protein B484DRAFT_264471 [Ochromonadaceae sp. CCMP2298]
MCLQPARLLVFFLQVLVEVAGLHLAEVLLLLHVLVQHQLLPLLLHSGVVVVTSLQTFVVGLAGVAVDDGAI